MASPFRRVRRLAAKPVDFFGIGPAGEMDSEEDILAAVGGLGGFVKRSAGPTLAIFNHGTIHMRPDDYERPPSRMQRP